jgi:hypothetical protein
MVESGRTTRSAEECEMSRSCQSRLRVASQHAREAADPLADDWIALVGHRARSLLALAKGLLDLSHLRPLQVPDLERQPLQRRPRDSKRRHELGMTVAWDDLGRKRLCAKAKALQDVCLDVGLQGRVGADRAGELADLDLLERPHQAPGIAVALEGEASQLEAESRGLGVHAVCATCADRVPKLARPFDERSRQL